MSRSSYSERQRGPKPRVEEHISPTLWAGILAFLERGAASGLFAERFPRECEDGRGVFATDRGLLMQALAAEVPELPVPLYERDVPPTLAVLDLVEFLVENASQAEPGGYHSHFAHHHLRFDRAAGQAEARDQLNRLLARNGTVFAIDESGQVARVVPTAVASYLRLELSATIDSDLDGLLETAARKHVDRDPDVRREAVEALWDAFERAKTVLNPDKKRGAEELIAVATGTGHDDEATLLRDEMRALTDIGNRFRIRHHETKAVQPSDALVDLLFRRMYALLLYLHEALR